MMRRSNRAEIRSSHRPIGGQPSRPGKPGAPGRSWPEPNQPAAMPASSAITWSAVCCGFSIG